MSAKLEESYIKIASFGSVKFSRLASPCKGSWHKPFYYDHYFVHVDLLVGDDEF